LTKLGYKGRPKDVSTLTSYLPQLTKGYTPGIHKMDALLYIGLHVKLQNFLIGIRQ